MAISTSLRFCVCDCFTSNLNAWITGQQYIVDGGQAVGYSLASGSAAKSPASSRTDVVVALRTLGCNHVAASEVGRIQSELDKDLVGVLAGEDPRPVLGAFAVDGDDRAPPPMPAEPGVRALGCEAVFSRLRVSRKRRPRPSSRPRRRDRPWL